MAESWVAEHPAPPEPVEPEGDEENYDELLAAFEEADHALFMWREAHPWVDIDDLVEHYDPPKPNNLADIRNELRTEDLTHQPGCEGAADRQRRLSGEHPGQRTGSDQGLERLRELPHDRGGGQA